MACKLAQSAGPRLRVPDKTTAIDGAQPAGMRDLAFTTLRMDDENNIFLGSIIIVIIVTIIIVIIIIIIIVYLRIDLQHLQPFQIKTAVWLQATA
eukprot:3321804-Amphidinium_carterae.1